MKVQPFFSVLVPTYNQAHFIADAVEGVLSQTFKDYELLILDDHSTDSTIDRISPYLVHSQVRYIQRPERLGRVNNYRVGVEKDAVGSWIIVCDGDDFYTDPDFLSTVYSLISANEELVIVQGGHYLGEDVAHATIHLPKVQENKVIIEGEEYIQSFFHIQHFSHLTTAYKTDIAKKVGMYTQDVLSSDINSLLKIAVFGKVALIRHPFALWRQHQSNASSTSPFSKRFKNLSWIEDCVQFFSNHHELLPTLNLANWRRQQVLVKYADFFVESIKIALKEKTLESVKLVLKKLKQESFENRIQFIFQLAQKFTGKNR